MQGTSFVAAILVGLSVQSTSSEDTLRVTNVTINITRHGGRNGFRVEARITNPNDFVVFNVVADCEIKDRRGTNLTSYTPTITDAIQANGTRIIRQLDTGQWPEEGRMAYCVSSEAKNCQTDGGR
jgi:hypothetical protein